MNYTTEMAFIIKCSNCGYIFYYSHTIKPLQLLIKPLPIRCPKCKKELNKELNGVKIKIEIKGLK